MANIELKAYIAALTALATADNAADYLLILDTDTNTLKKVLPEDLGITAGGIGEEVATSSLKIGTDALDIATPISQTVAIGFESAKRVAESNEDVFVGYRAGYGDAANVESAGNVGVGTRALEGATEAIENTCVGNFSGIAITDGFGNTCVGAYGGQDLTEGGENTIIGYNAGSTVSGWGNTIIGAYAGLDSSFLTGENNVIIGYFAGNTTTDFSNKLVIDATGGVPSEVEDALVYGEFDNQVVILNGTLSVRPQGSGGATSVHFDESAVAGETRMLLYDVDNGTLERVSVGAADSGGSGYKVLRIPN